VEETLGALGAWGTTGTLGAGAATTGARGAGGTTGAVGLGATFGALGVTVTTGALGGGIDFGALGAGAVSGALGTLGVSLGVLGVALALGAEDGCSKYWQPAISTTIMAPQPSAEKNSRDLLIFIGDTRFRCIGEGISNRIFTTCSRLANDFTLN
jgi:hypothetical protein